MPPDTTNHTYAVILCGGSGTRLWPLSRATRPKHLLALNGDESLLQQTVLRLMRRVPPARIVTVTHTDHRFEVLRQLSDIHPDLCANVLPEPVARNTLPAVAYAVKFIMAQDADALIGVFPSDHAIADEAAFDRAWALAEQGALQDYLTLIGIRPDFAATGYGYIAPDAPIAPTLPDVLEVRQFVEKPDAARAAGFVRDGYLWNGGMFIFRAEVFMALLAQYQPTLYAIVDAMPLDDVSAAYAAMPSISMDYGIAEHAERVAVVPASMAWSDLGNWDAIFKQNGKDASGNVTQGEVMLLDTQDSMVWNSHGLLATIGVKDIAVIQTPDATLICDRARTEEIKELVAQVKMHKPELAETHLTVYRPWGHYTVLQDAPNYKVKRIELLPGARLSLQSHAHRSEHWVVVSGKARITKGDDIFELEVNQSTYIPQGVRHRLENADAVPLKIIEVQSGSYVGEDDITRYEDIYGRAIDR